MTSKIIELKEIYDPEAKSQVPGEGIQKLNGDFRNDFEEKIRIDKGDAVKIKSVFINDASGPEGNIVLQNDLPVTLNVGYYVRDWGSYNYQDVYLDGRTYTQKVGEAANTQPRTNKHFVFCRPNTFTGTEQKITSIDIEWPSNKVHSDWLGFNAQLEFKYDQPGDIPGTGSGTIKFSITKRTVKDLLRTDNLTGKNFIRLDANTNDRLKKGHIPFPFFSANNPQFQTIPVAPLGSGDIINFAATTTTAGVQHFVPHIKPLKFTIPKNEEGYSPQQFAQIVTESATLVIDNQAHALNSPADSDLLTTTAVEEATPGGIYLDENGEFAYTTSVIGHPERTSWVGANQFAVVYRDDLGGKFEIQSMHMPLYSGNQEGNLLIGNGTFNYVANKHSGIFLDSCDPPDFFSRFMNIDDSIFGAQQNNIGTDPTDPTNYQLTGFPNGTIFPTFNFIEGVNCTGNLVSVDSLVDKGNFSFEQPLQHTLMSAAKFATTGGGSANAGVSESFIAESQHFTILGSTSLLPQLDDPYYLIELTMPIMSQYNSSIRANKKVQAIVGRFYNTNGYTQAVEGEGALSYVHTSEEPIYISSIKCRILDSKGNLASNIKDDNTVFIEILKQDPNQI